MAHKPQPIRFSKDERAAIVARIQDYCESELEVSIGAIPAEQLLAFFADSIGAYYYNRGLRDAETLLKRKIEDFTDEIYGLEQREARRS